MLTFRCTRKEIRFEIVHEDETFYVTVCRKQVRRNEPAWILVRGPLSFETEEFDDDGMPRVVIWHNAREMTVRVCYAASSTSSRLIVIFDATRVWAIRWLRPVDDVNATAPEIVRGDPEIAQGDCDGQLEGT